MNAASIAPLFNMISTSGKLTNKRLLTIAVSIFLSRQIVEYLIVIFTDNHIYNLCDFDCYWYGSIVEKGYDLEPWNHPKGDAANWAFFPLHPYLARIIAYLSNQPSGIALIITSKILFLLAIFAFMKFAIVYGKNMNPILAGAVVAFSPFSIYGNTGYTESLFMFLCCLSFYFLKREQYLKSAVFGALLSATRLAGFFFLVAYFVYGIVHRVYSNISVREKFLLGLLVIPLGLSAFMLHLYLKMGDALAFVHIQKAWGRSPQNPLDVLLSGFNSTGINLISAVVTLIAMVFIIILIVRKHYELAIFSLLSTIIPLSTGLASMPRYLWWQPPILLVLTELINRKKLWLIFFPASIYAMTWAYISWFKHAGFMI